MIERARLPDKGGARADDEDRSEIGASGHARKGLKRNAEPSEVGFFHALLRLRAKPP